MLDWENKIKLKIEEREIEPTPSAWDRLDHQLSESTPKETVKKKSRTPYWIGIAASICILMVLGFILWNASSNNTFTPNEDKIVKTDKDFIAPKEVKDDPIVPDKQLVVPSTPPSSEQQHTKYRNDIAAENEKAAAVEPQQKPMDKEIIDHSIVYDHPENSNDLLVEQNTVDSVNDIELLAPDELLAQAMSKRKLHKENKIVVDANRLLNEAENKVFVEKRPDLLEKLTNQIKTIQVTLSKRNQSEK